MLQIMVKNVADYDFNKIFSGQHDPKIECPQKVSNFLGALHVF